MKITVLKSIGQGRFLAAAGASIVTALAGSDPGDYPLPGDEAEAVESGGILKIMSTRAPSYMAGGTFESGVAVSRTGEIPGAKVIESTSAIKAGGEGASPLEAFEAMAGAARSVNANAVLDARLECVIGKIPRKRVLYRYTGRPALADGGSCHARPGIGLNTRAPSRTNSPNRAMARYLRVLLASGLLILLPSAARLCALHGMERYVPWICLSLAVAVLALGILVFPRGMRSFILR